MTAQAILSRLRAASPRARLLGAAAAAGLLSVAALGFAGWRDTRVALFATPLRADQVAEVEQRLAAWSVPFAPATDNLRVDRAKRSELLLKLSLAGVPHPHLAGSEEALAHLGALTPQAVLE